MRPAKGSRHLIGGPSGHQELSISAAKAIKGPIILPRNDRGRCERLTNAAVELQIGTQKRSAAAAFQTRRCRPGGHRRGRQHSTGFRCGF